jgi:outer membrane protein insertion porin family
MKRVLRDVVAGAVSAVATVGAGTGALLASSEALAQEGEATVAPQAQPSGVAIRRIVVEGNQRIEPATISSYLLVRPGDTFDAERIDLSLKTLFATGLFADVQIEQRGADLVVAVIENPIINRVIFEGMRTLDEEDLEDEVFSLKVTSRISSLKRLPLHSSQVK